MDKHLIIERIKQSDKSAFNELFIHYYNRLCRFAYVILHCEHTAEEVVQETFVKLWEKRKAINISGNLDSYLFVSVRNASLNSVKYTSARKNSIASDEFVNDTETEPFNQEVFLKRLHLALGKLPEQCRIIYFLKNMEGLTQDEIAQYLNLSPKTIENQLKIATLKLREMLYRYKHTFYNASE